LTASRHADKRRRRRRRRLQFHFWEQAILIAMRDRDVVDKERSLSGGRRRIFAHYVRLHGRGRGRGRGRSRLPRLLGGRALTQGTVGAVHCAFVPVKRVGTRKGLVARRTAERSIPGMASGVSEQMRGFGERPTASAACLWCDHGAVGGEGAISKHRWTWHKCFQTGI
jgi:hypothetical protein